MLLAFFSSVYGNRVSKNLDERGREREVAIIGNENILRGITEMMLGYLQHIYTSSMPFARSFFPLLFLVSKPILLKVTHSFFFFFHFHCVNCNDCKSMKSYKSCAALCSHNMYVSTKMLIHIFFYTAHICIRQIRCMHTLAHTTYTQYERNRWNIKKSDKCVHILSSLLFSRVSNMLTDMLLPVVKILKRREREKKVARPRVSTL